MKNKFFKKALSVFTAMAMALSLMTGIPFSELGLGIIVSAAEIVANGTCGAQGNESSVTWSLDSDGTLTISGTGAMADYELVVDDYPYHYTTPWHNTDNDGRYQNSNIKKVVVEEGVTRIGSSAFKDFTELTSISIPNTVKSIGNGSVSYCEKLTSLVIPDSATSIGEEAFYQNLMLTSVTIGNSVESIGDHAFYRVGCNAGTNFTITLPKSVTSIAPSAFTSIYKGATIRYSCSYNEGNGYSTGNNTFNATLVQYHLCEYSSSGNEINCSRCTCGEYSSSTATLSLSSDEPIYYTGEEIKPAVTVTYPDGWGGDKIEPNESNCTYSDNINAGTATCTFKYAEGVEASIDFTIEKVDSVITAAPTPADLVYDGTALNLINAGTTTDGEMQYSLEENGTYSITIPTGTDAKTYTVWYKVVGDKNHNDTEPEKVEVSIAKGTPDIGTVSASNLENTLDVSQVVLSRSNETVPGTLSLAEGTTLQYGIHDYTYVFTPNDNTNYETVTGTVSITISDTNKPTATYKVGTDEWKQFINTITFGHFCKDYTTVDITYSDEGSGVADKQYYISEEEITNTENIQWSEYTDTLNINATGKYYIYVRVTDNYGNVVIQNSEGIVVYAESVIAPTSHSCEYGAENSLYVDIISTNGNTFANLTDGSGNEIDTENYSYSIDERTLTIKGEYLSDLDVGEYTYKICMNPQGVENTEATLAYSFVVKVVPKELTVTADNKSKTYGEDDPTFTYTATGLVNGDTLTGTLSRETGENAETYAITQGTLTNENNPNYDITFVEGTFTINKATPPALTFPTATSITYGDTLSSSVLSDSSWAWVDGTIVPNASAYYNAYIEVDDSNYDYTDVDGYDDVNHRVVRGIDVSIRRATLTITANSYTIKVGSALPTYEYTVTGLVGNDTLPIDVTISCNAADSNTVGTYPITISGVASDALASLYAPIYVNGELTISEKDIQEIAADDVTLTYGETKNIGATTNGNGAISYSTTSDVISVAADGTITAHKAGTATVTITAAETADYAEATKTISVTVNKKKVAVPTADTTKYTYTGTAQTYGVTSTDDYTVEGGVQTNAGEYPITITLNNENYEWDGTLGTYKFVINKAAVTVTAKSYTIKVGDTLPTYAYDVTGLVNSETLPIDVTISCNAADSNTAGTYDIIVSGAAASDNYTFAFVNGKLTVVETSAGGETGGESGGNEGGVGGSESIPAVTTPSTTPSYTGRPSWVTTPSETTTTTTTTTTQPPVDDDTDDEDVEIDEATDTTKPADGDEPQIKGDNGKTGWDAIADELSDTEEGGKVVVDMNGATEVPADIFEQLQGQDINFVIELDNGFTWTINGEDVTEPMDIDLGVNEGSEIPVKVINSVTDECEYITLTLSHNGDFGFKATLTVDMGEENEGLYANLYWYTDDDTEFICSDKISSKGKTDLTFTHASEYIIVIDETNHGKRVEESDNADEDADSDVDNIFNGEEDDDVNPFTAVTISFTGVIISAATIMIARKRKKQ